MGFDKRPKPELGPDGSIYVRAPAKINLFLHVTGRRDDGYHTLESLFVYTKRGDLLRIKPADCLELSVSGPFAHVLEDTDPSKNLVFAAAHKLAAFAGVDCRADIELEKNLPIASGLGGGSADAAAALVGLSRFWNLDISVDDLLSIALELGADVPACLYSESLMARGIGEKITPLTLPWDAGVVIVNPNVAVSTPMIFKGFREYREKRNLPPFDIALRDVRAVTTDINALNLLTSNSLQDAACTICPEIMEVTRFIKQNSQTDFVRMTGSGASVVALYHNKEAANAVASRVREHAPHWWVMADEIAS
ncbi:4-(cytidine 5'-diphospho)-2-C-methyl-D-erythritol kinase [Kordiimonas aquimaris]|uniref:4-(cytidine 5'-diphospho)-2-C-methyl-D-erythritol kinase n=1 Tax=Kordiimonas aquimaris TaxID=707591 RepID=UPI0021D0DBF6|nr:4-(cytidine 5'-diphospho)-2-C-methyl-D-erythritol kinase [Kordiimonas aquimaris]